jgi:hypothetical protein
MAERVAQATAPETDKRIRIVPDKIMPPNEAKESIEKKSDRAHQP